MARIFLSHASEDLALAGELHRWLIEAGHQVFLDQDLRDGIAVGEEWEQRLHERLRWANAVVCVVTSAYLASEWCTAEVSIARSRGNRLLPVRAEPGVAHALLKSIQHTDLTRDPVTARVALAEALRRVDDAGDSGWPDDRSPFPGLRPFDIDRHRVFFGRTGEVEQLAGLLRSTAERAEGAALLVVGPSGCGKSSLVRAGLLPVMAGEPGWWTLPPIVPGADPVAALARGLAMAAREIDLDWTVEHVRHQLHQAGLTGLVSELLLAAPGGSQRRLLVVVDQFEELLTQAAPAERARFVELLRPTLTGPVQLVGTLRPEFLDQLLGDPELAALPTHTYVLRPLRREALRAVIEEPVRLAGIGVGERLVARLIEDTDSGEALPLLAFTLAQLADGISRGGQLSEERYEQLGGVQGALTREADAALADAITAGGRSREEVIAGLLRLVTVDEQGRPTRWRVPRDELPDSTVTESEAFVARRLLSTDTDNGTVVIGAAHEAFLSTWPPLDEAITASASALRARRAVEHATTEWSDNGHPRSRLWAGGQLAAAMADTGARIHARTAPADAARRRGSVGWLPRRHRVLVTDRVELSPRARDFLHASIRHDRYRRRRATTVLSVLLALALAAAGIAVIQQRAAQERQLVATARQLVAQAELARDTDPRTALQLGLAAHRIHPDGETHASLVNLLTSTHYATTLTGYPDSVSSVAFAPDGHTLATATATEDPVNATPSATADGTVILWDLTDPAQPRPLGPPLTGHTGSVLSVAFAPDGRTLATGSADGTVILWDLTDRTQPRQLGAPLTDHTDDVSSVAFAPDGRTLATASANGTVLLWDLTDRTQPRQLGAPLTDHTDDVSSVAFAPDGRTLATASANGTVLLWDLTDRTQPRRLGAPLTGHPNYAVSLAFAPDGRTLAVATGSIDGSADGRVILWDLTDPSQPGRLGAPLIGHAGYVLSVAFAPDGRTLATGSADRTVILWDLADPAQPRPLSAPLTGDAGLVSSVAFAPDGRTLATTGQDGTVILWDLTDRTQPRQLGAPLTGDAGYVSSVGFAPDGRTLATGHASAVILWDLTDSTQPRQLGAPLTSHTGPVAFAPDGRTLATGSADETVILWDLTDRTQPRQLGAPLTSDADYLLSVAFASDGHTLATATASGNNNASAVILWDLTDPTQPGRLGAPLTGHAGYVFSVAFDPDGRTLATGSADGTVILWDLTDPTQPGRLSAPLTGHTDSVSSVTFDPDGRTLATGSADGTVILWDLTDPTQPGRLGAPLNDHTDSVLSVTFDPDGRTLATGSEDSTAILWDLMDLDYLLSHAVERACSIARGGLDRDEWDRRIRGLPYQDTCPS